MQRLILISSVWICGLYSPFASGLVFPQIALWRPSRWVSFRCGRRQPHKRQKLLDLAGLRHKRDELHTPTAMTAMTAQQRIDLKQLGYCFVLMYLFACVARCAMRYCEARAGNRFSTSWIVRTSSSSLWTVSASGIGITICLQTYCVNVSINLNLPKPFTIVLANGMRLMV
jgi:hypothetical protein